MSRVPTSSRTRESGGSYAVDWPGLEKGLLMRRRQEVFALDYISETVSCYERIICDGASGTFNLEELVGGIRWVGRLFAEEIRRTAVPV